MHLSKWILIFALSYTSVVSAGTVDQIYIKDNTPALKGSSVQIMCEVSQFTYLDLFSLYKVDSIPDNVKSISALVHCSVYVCLSTFERYAFNISRTLVEIAIVDLKRSEDQKWWICAFGNQTKQLKLIVYTPPVELTLGGSKAGGDLQEEAIILSCKSSNCVYPAPHTFRWFYQESTETDASWFLYQNTTPSISESSCSDSEKSYTSSLQLPKYTTWPLQPLNTEKSVRFQCRMSFPTIQLRSDPSGSVKYAVRVRSVTLKDGNSTPSESLHVIGGDAKTLTCETGISRPTSTIVWYIGTAERQRSSYNSFTFIPQNNENGKQLYCKAFNIQSEGQAVTSKAVTLNLMDTIAQAFYIEGHFGQENVTVNEHDTEILFKCIVNSNPKVDIKIMFEGNVLKEQVNESSLAFVRRETSCSDAGVYTCEVNNMYGRKSTQNITLFVQFSDQQQTDKESSRQASDNTALIVGLILGAVCCIVIIYAIYVTISKNILLRKATNPLGSSGSQGNYANATFAQDVTNAERYDGNTGSNQETSDQQYTDLSRYANADMNTYDVIKKI